MAEKLAVGNKVRVAKVMFDLQNSLPLVGKVGTVSTVYDDSTMVEVALENDSADGRWFETEELEVL